MNMSGTEDETDFRPFFDMVIGILFVLIILVTAQIYFQQSHNNSLFIQTARQEAAIRRSQATMFLNTIVDQLHDVGIDAVADIENDDITFTLETFAALPTSGSSTIQPTTIDLLGSILLNVVSCVTEPKSTLDSCKSFDRLYLDKLEMQAKIASAHANQLLSTARLGDLVSAMIYAAMLKDVPKLLEASTSLGNRVMMLGATSTMSNSISKSELALAFTFD